MINNNWRVLGIELIDTREFAKIRRQQYRENRSAHVATIGSLVERILQIDVFPAH